jgi:hypothetical protein
MKFLTNWAIDLEKVPAYVEFNQDFTEHIDYDLAMIILESDDERITPESKAEFRKLVQCIDRRTNTLPVRYAPRRGKLGRRYPECPRETYSDGRPDPNYGKYYSALISMPRIIKNTLYYYQGWRDYDQVKGHPTILLELATRNNIPLPAYKDYLQRFDEIVEDLSQFYSADPENPITKRDIKWLFNKTIYGGGFDKWIEKIQIGDPKSGDSPKEVRNHTKKHSVYQRFYDDTQRVIDLVYLSNTLLAEKVCGDLPDTPTNLWSRKNRVMSYFCGIIENEITCHAYKYGCKSNLCQKRIVSWGYDGFTIPPFPDTIDESTILSEMNDYIKQKTGFTKVSIIPKEYDKDEILYDCITRRQKIPVALPVVPEIVGEAVMESEMNDQDDEYLLWKKNFEKQWCKIKNTACFMRTCYLPDGKFEKFILQNEAQLVSAYKHESYIKNDARGKQKKVSFIKEWLEDTNMLCYDDAEVYPPPLVCPSNKFNLWRPFTYEGDTMTVDDPDFDEEGVKMWCDHLKILCNNEEPTYNYVSCWVAHSIQQPAVKPECMITFVSSEGVGKNIFTSSLSAIYGAGKKLETTSPERECWGSFNTPMASAYLIVLSETDKRNTGGADGKIKALITDPPLTINPKGKDQYTITSYHRLITNSNSADPTKTHQGDRRNLIVRCSDEKKGDCQYFATLSERLSRPNTLRSIYCCLKATDLTKWSFRDIPRTAYHDVIIENSRPALEIFLEYFTMNNCDTPYKDLYGVEMLQHFRSWKELTKYAFDEKMSEGNLLKRLLTELNLPSDAITKLSRTNKGQKRRYDMAVLRKRFNIPDDLEQDDLEEIDDDEM